MKWSTYHRKKHEKNYNLSIQEKETDIIYREDEVKQFIKDIKKDMDLSLENSEVINRLAGKRLI